MTHGHFPGKGLTGDLVFPRLLSLLAGVRSRGDRDNPAFPLDGKVRCNYINPPLISGDRWRTAKTLVDRAIKEKKVFSVKGPYPVIRAGLRARGWVERRMPHQSRRLDPETDATDEGDSSDYDDLGEEAEKDDEAEDLYDLMSRLVRNETTYFYWTTKRDSIDCRALRKDQMTNHYAKSASFTTKVGLCLNLRNLQWFDAADPDTFFPRCYRLGAPDEKQAFIDDFKRTACISILLYVVEKYEGVSEWESTGKIHSATSHGLNRSRKQQSNPKIAASLIDTALRVCLEYLNSLEHSDIDISLETSPSVPEHDWKMFLQNYHSVVHNGLMIEGCEDSVQRCKSILEQMRQVCPQMENDGICNIWIIKPDQCTLTDSKWVVQKYIERPLLIHGTKFDVRQWFLVTDWNPLTVWFYRECYLRFSTQPYSTHTLDSSVHLCNNSIQKHFQPSLDRNPSLPAECMWSCSQFRSWLAASGRDALWERVVVPGMQKAIIQTLLTAQDTVEPRKASFELYGADFMIGRDLCPWLLEINASPTMARSTGVTARLCPAVQEDTLRVVLDRRGDRYADTGGFQLIFKQSLPEPLYKTTRQKSSSAKENHLMRDKKDWLPFAPRKVSLDTSLMFHAKLRNRNRLVLPSTCCVLPNPENLHPLKPPPSQPVPDSLHSFRTRRNLPSLYRPKPSVDAIGIKPSQSLSSSH
ncbi:hypothetical protein DNTS_020756, partial [Danionella cerebrum]